MAVGIPATPRAKITLSGGIAGGKWASSFWLSRTIDTGPTGSMNDVADALWAIFNTDVFAAWAPFSATSTNIAQLDVGIYHASSNAAFALGSHTVSGGAATATTTSAASQAIVLTLLTAQVGKVGRGRMYLPATAGLTLSPAYAFNPTLVTALVAAMANFFGDCSAAFDAQGMGLPVPSVSSGGSSLSGGLGPALYPVTAIRADNRPDRQEHREKGLTFSTSIANV